ITSVPLKIRTSVEIARWLCLSTTNRGVLVGFRKTERIDDAWKDWKTLRACGSLCRVQAEDRRRLSAHQERRLPREVLVEEVLSGQCSREVRGKWPRITKSFES